MKISAKGMMSFDIIVLR